MIVIPPVIISDANLVSSDVPEPSAGEAVWSSGSNYAAGQVVIRTQTHRKYESITGGVDAGLPENTPTKWLDVGPTNRWAMFDINRNIQTTRANSMTIVISPNKRINSIVLLGVEASEVTISMVASSSTVYGPVTVNMNGRTSNSWLSYFFGEFDYKPTLILTDLPPYASATITVVFSNPGQTAKCAGIVMGNKVFLGNVQYNAKSDNLNFSKIERDEFGNSLLIPRRTIPKTNQVLISDKNTVNTLREVRTLLNATPAYWSGLDEKYDDDYFEAIAIYGIYKQFEIDIGHPSFVTVNLELEEL